MIMLLLRQMACRHEHTYLSKERGLSCLILGHLVKGVLSALLALAEGLSLLGNVYHGLL